MDGIITLVMGWTLAIFMAALTSIILWRIITNRIDLNGLLSEKDGSGASLSRFQFLVFTFVIAMSLFLIVVGHNPPKFPNSIPGGVLALLGISGSSYLVSKVVQKANSGGDGSPTDGGPGGGTNQGPKPRPQSRPMPPPSDNEAEG